MYIINFIRGFCMALADSVPGVSGGTIAFILGFYDKFITSLNDLFSTKSNKKAKLNSLLFLFKLGLGWITGFIFAVLFIASVFENNIYKISSLFIGLIIFSIPTILKEEKNSLKNKYKNILFTFIGIFIVWAITYFNPITKSGGSSLSFSLEHFNILLAVYVFFSGMIAISAMVLPGISGSTLLLILGLYTSVISAIKEILTFNLTYVPLIAALGLGILFGIFSIISLLKYLLKNHRSKMIYFILGLMIGSIYAVIMGPCTLKVPQNPLTFKTFSIIFFIIGGLLILSLEKLKDILNKN
ncbi:DUF368 domain-containing protein [Clostridium sp. BJN0001]|uniref:DUF368 domain-containing protein n=1 Tax=Clostridium sp. BJN0001 TaxID=2930219 RepID=UPI001FD16224|nr:DUF368 domain-containing protein [Clostridium sp. BJN0001]